MAAPLQMASAIFLLATKVMCAPSAIKAEQNTFSTKHNIPELESENIRESTLDFTAHFCEINPDILYLCRRGLPGLKTVRRESIKNVKSSIFRKKTSKFLSSLPF